jgi:hypothetical protein
MAIKTPQVAFNEARAYALSTYGKELADVVGHLVFDEDDPVLKADPSKKIIAWYNTKSKDVVEGRIEQRAINASHAYVRSGIRSAVQQTILPGVVAHEGPITPSGLSSVYALLYARVVAGTIDMSEIENIDAVARTYLSDDAIDWAQDIIKLAITTTTPVSVRDIDYMISLADEWIELFGSPDYDADVKVSAKPTTEESEGSEGETANAKAKPTTSTDDEDEEEDTGSADAGESDDDDADPEDDIDDGGKDGSDIDGPSSKGDEAAGDSFTEQDSDAIKEALERDIADVAANPDRDFTEQTADAKKTAAEVLNKPRRSAAWMDRNPSGALTHISNDIAHRMEQIALPAIVSTPVRTAVPPGRLHTREALRSSAERGQGMMSTAAPWKAHKRQHTMAPPITLGIMTDVSGSMSWAQELVAQVTYIFGRAGSMIGARTAAVVFGDYCELSLAPGEIPNIVKERSANGGSEAADKAWAALDGMLNLTNGPAGTKVVLVVSDADFVNDRDYNANPIWVDRMKKAGVTIIWANNSLTSYGDSRFINTRISPTLGPKAVADAIMASITKEVKACGS